MLFDSCSTWSVSCVSQDGAGEIPTGRRDTEVLSCWWTFPVTVQGSRMPWFSILFGLQAKCTKKSPFLTLASRHGHGCKWHETASKAMCSLKGSERLRPVLATIHPYSASGLWESGLQRNSWDGFEHSKEETKPGAWKALFYPLLPHTA